jgi:hypothetical protein
MSSKKRNFYVSIPLDSFNPDGVQAHAARRGVELLAVDSTAYTDLTQEEKAEITTAKADYLFRCPAKDILHATGILASIKAELLLEMDLERRADQDGEGDSDWKYEADDGSEGTARWS